MKRKLIGLILSASLLLVGCGEDLDAKSQSKEVPSEMLLEVYDYMDTLPENLERIGNYLRRISESPNLMDENLFKDSFMGSIDEYHAYLSAIDAPPTTEFDFELEKSFGRVIESMISGLNSLRLFVETGYVEFLDLYDKYLVYATASQKDMNVVLQKDSD